MLAGRHRVDEPGAARGARRALGPAAGRPPPLEDSLWEALRDAQLRALHGGDGGEPGRAVSRSRREAVDCYAALEPGPRPVAAWAAGAFADEVVPVRCSRTGRPAEPTPWAADEHMRPDTTLEALAKLPPYFKKDGVVTAGQRVRDLRRRRGAGRRERAAMPPSAASGRSAGWWPGRRGRGPEHHGHRPGARVPPGAGARGARRSRTWTWSK